MIYRNSLLLGATLASVSLTTAGISQAATSKKQAAHHRGFPITSAGLANSELSELRDEVRALREQNDALAQNQAAIQAQIVAAQVQTSQIAAESQSVQDRLDAVPQVVRMAVGELPKPKPSWSDRTQIGGTIFLDGSSISQKSNGRSVTPSGTAFDVKRAYITIDHQFNDIYSANVTTDFQYIRALNGVPSVAGAAPGVTTTSSATATNELFVKKAYLQAKYATWFTVRLGGAELPWVPFVESVEGNRYIDNMLIDRTKFGTTTDWGVHVFGSSAPLFDPKTGPVISYAVSAVDGSGFRTPPGTNSAPRSNTLDVEGRVSARWYDVTAAIGGYSGRLGNDAGAQFNAPSAAVTYRDATRFDAFLAWTPGPFKLGVEYFSANNWTAVTNRTTGDKADGYSVFGAYQFAPSWSVFGRYDHTKPNKTTAPTRKEDYSNLGFSYSPVKSVDLALAYKHDEVDHGTLSTSNGVIGGTLGGTYDEVGIFTQIKY